MSWSVGATTTNTIDCLTVLGAGSLRSGHQQGGVLVRARFLAGRWQPSLRSHMVKRKRGELLGVSSYCCSAPQSCPTLSHPWTATCPGFPVLHHLLELAQIHVHWVSDVIQPSHPLSSPSPPALNPFQHQHLFQWVSSSHQVAKVLELQLQHLSFLWIFWIDFQCKNTNLIVTSLKKRKEDM